MPAFRQVPSGGVQSMSTPLVTNGSGYVMGTQFVSHGIVSVMKLVGQRMMGGSPWPGRTSTLNEHETDWPQLFVAVQVTGWMPTGRHAPDGGLQLASAPFPTMGAG